MNVFLTFRKKILRRSRNCPSISTQISTDLSIALGRRESGAIHECVQYL
jgi:hypothetical protein